MKERVDRPPLSATDGIAWTGLLGAPLIWFISQQASYTLVPWACHGGPLIAIHLVNLAALLLEVIIGAVAWREWRGAGAVSDELAPPAGRVRFLGMAGLMLSVLFGLVILAQTTGAFFFDPCER